MARATGAASSCPPCISARASSPAATRFPICTQPDGGSAATQRGLLDSKLVVWGGEFGCTPQSEKGDGRDHNPTGFTRWMAGGGVRGGQTIGSTDEVGLHATILWLMGLDHMRLEYNYKGRPKRPTINEGEVCRKITGI